VVAITGSFGSYSVDDVGAATEFYTNILGLEVNALGDQGPLFVNGPKRHSTFLYLKPDHRPADFTVLNLVVQDIDEAVDDLAERGIEFLRYDGVEADARGIAHGPGRSVAWFQDPAGNVLSVAQIDGMD
jgi:catechol 2,3-dioxygenase-like lactoylglutathione lyase family enzyme